MPPTVFIVSDGTGITAETFAHSILSQFDQKFRLVRVPFVDSTEKAYATLEKINEAIQQDGRRPIVFTTLVDSASNQIVKGSNALVLDMFQTFVEPLEQELELKSSHAMGRGHQNADTEEYKNRILDEYENAGPGERSALLRREGLHYTNISSWRRKRVG